MKKIFSTILKTKKSLFFYFIFSFCLFSFDMKAQNFCDGDYWNDGFNWQQPTFQMYLSPQGAQSIPSPYHAYGAFLNQNIEPLSWPSSKDYNPSDGWVHIAHDFGTPSTNVPNPHLILYNRGTGFLRVFFLVTQLYDQNNRATVSIRFGNGSKKTALLEQYASTNGMNAVNTFATYAIDGKVPNALSNSVPYWIFADFAMTYDPCTCTTGNSKLYIQLDLYKKEILNFTLNGQVIQDLKNNVGGSGPTFTSSMKPLTDVTTQINNILTTSKNLGNINKETSGWSAFSQILGSVAGPWAGLADFALGLLNGPQSSTPVPLMFNAKFDANGEVNFQATSKVAIIANPGSYTGGVDPSLIPPYNHILGTYNLITPPKVNLRKSYQGTTGFAPQDCDIEFNYYQYELTQPIKWIYNPRMPLIWVEWRAAYVITFSDGKRVLTEDFPMGCFQSYKPVFRAERRRGGCNYTEPYPIRVQIQLLGKTWLENGAQSIFMQVYNCDQTTINQGDAYLVATKPSPWCSDYTEPATLNDIQSVCYSSAYRDRAATFTANDSIPETEYLASVAKNSKSLILKDKTADNQLNISPNPINEMGVINYELNAEGKISVYLTDVLGKVVKSFIQDEFKEKGRFSIDFIRNDLNSGIYFVVMETNLGRVTQKLMLK
jgi:hypothetical protein